MHDPRKTIPLGAAIVAAVTTATVTTYIFLSGGYRYETIPRTIAALTYQQRAIVKLAKDNGPGSGILYVWGGTSRRGFDCSGFVYHVLNAAGVTIHERTSFAMWAQGGHRVPRNDVSPGDVVFFRSYGNNANPGHVGLYIGSGKMIEYYRTGYPARLDYLNEHRDYIGAKRWWKPIAIRKHIYSTAVWITHHWGIRISASTGWTVTYVPALGHHRFDRAKRARIVKWAHHNHHRTSGNRTYLNIKLH